MFLQKGIAEVITLLFKNMPNQPYVLGLPFSRFNYECQDFFFLTTPLKLLSREERCAK